jgi:murein DD-endopeptidase MepM/ murein hydrolase activator NlpD
VVPGQLAFPFRDPAAASELHGFGLDPWSADGEVHGGIDVAAARSGSQPTRKDVAIVAPAPGRVEWVVEGTTGAGLFSILVLLRLNDLWFVTLTIEPQSAAPATVAAQRAAVRVTPGDRVAGGATIADLVVWNVAAGSYPHVHFGLLYKNPAETLEHVRDHVLEVAISDGTGLPPAQGPGSPLDPRDLGIETTFFCPYAFSGAAARAAYEALPAFAVDGGLCACPCAYGSKAGDCGRCGPASR